MIDNKKEEHNGDHSHFDHCTGGIRSSYFCMGFRQQGKCCFSWMGEALGSGSLSVDLLCVNWSMFDQVDFATLRLRNPLLIRRSTDNDRENMERWNAWIESWSILRFLKSNRYKWIWYHFLSNLYNLFHSYDFLMYRGIPWGLNGYTLLASLGYDKWWLGHAQ